MSPTELPVDTPYPEITETAPVQEGSGEVYPVPAGGETSPDEEPDSATAYPPSEDETVPSPTLTPHNTLPAGQATPTATRTPQALMTVTPSGQLTDTSSDTYPGSEDEEEFVPEEDVEDPYPGAEDEEQIAPEEDEESGEETDPEQGDETDALTSTPFSAASPASLETVRTQLIATNPEGFSLASGELQLVELFAFWSPLSQSMAPVMYLMEDAYGDQIRFVYLDIDDPANALFKALLGNRLPPVFFLLDEQGNVLQEWQGYVKAEEFEQVFSSIIVTE